MKINKRLIQKSTQHTLSRQAPPPPPLSRRGAFNELPALNAPFRDNRGGLSRKGVPVPTPSPFPSHSHSVPTPPPLRDKPVNLIHLRMGVDREDYLLLVWGGGGETKPHSPFLRGYAHDVR